jgi:hypothetical protein
MRYWIIGLIWFSLACLPAITYSQESTSYMYIEGVRGIPFRLKLNRTEIPMLHKGYYLCPLKNSGENTIDIEFAGDLYPPQRFILDANNNSVFGFRLGKTVENKFYLIDLVNEGKIIETNSEVNIGLSTLDNTINYRSNLIVDPIPEEVVVDKKTKKENKKAERELEEEQRSKEEALEKARKASKDSLLAVEKRAKREEARRIKEEKEAAKAALAQSKKEELARTSTKPTPNPEVVIKTDNPSSAIDVNSIAEPTPLQKKLFATNCPQTSSKEEVQSLVARMNSKSMDDDKLILLKKKVFSGCISCNQLYSIIETFGSAYTKFAAIKFMRSSISDIQNLTLLKPLFKSETNKTKLESFMYN